MVHTILQWRKGDDIIIHAVAMIDPAASQFKSKLIKELSDLKNIKSKDRKDFVCNYLSELKGIKGFIYNNYCLGFQEQSQLRFPIQKILVTKQNLRALL